MNGEPRPVYPQMGWSCIKCKRAFAGMQQKFGCPYCPRKWMKVLIDKEHMVFLHKMEDYATLSKLCDMEYPHLVTSGIYCDHHNDFSGLTDLELKLLIKNSSGPNVQNVFSRDALLKIIHAMIQHMPEREVNAHEVAMQHATIDPSDKRRYRYVPGGFLPALVQEGVEEYAGWTYTAGVLPGAASAANAPVAATPAPRAVSAVPGLAATPAHVQEGDGFTMPKAGTSTHTIFMFCAERWKEMNHQDDATTLDKIRKQAVEALVAQGLNISTIRTQASRWYQHRQRLVL